MTLTNSVPSLGLSLPICKMLGPGPPSHTALCCLAPCMSSSFSSLLPSPPPSLPLVARTFGGKLFDLLNLSYATCEKYQKNQRESSTIVGEKSRDVAQMMRCRGLRTSRWGPVLVSWQQWGPAGTLMGQSLWLLLGLLQTHLFSDTCLSVYQAGGTHPGDGAPRRRGSLCF